MSLKYYSRELKQNKKIISQAGIISQEIIFFVIKNYKTWTIPRIKRIITPNILAYVPINLLANLPIIIPLKVKRKLQIAKTLVARLILSVMAFIPSPTEKLSRLTPKANKRIPKKFKLKELLKLYQGEYRTVTQIF